MTTARLSPAGSIVSSGQIMANSVEYRSFSQSSQLVELGKGAEGKVFHSQSLGNHVYKEFLHNSRTVPNKAALERLVDLRGQWTSEESAWLLERTVWPETLVVDQGRLKGFLMPMIGQRFFRQYGIRSNPKKVPCEWNYLSMRTRFQTNPNLVSNVPNVSPLQAMLLVHDLAKSVMFFHRHNVIIGDISGRNLLWTDFPKFQVLIIDCDSFRVSGSGGVASPKQSPDWDDPDLQGKPTTQESDVYKLALAAYRAVWAATTERPQSPHHSVPAVPNGVPDVLRDLITRSMAKSGRPSAEEWVTELASAAAMKGRPAIKMGGAKTNAPAQGSPTQVVQPALNRPTIDLSKQQ